MTKTEVIREALLRLYMIRNTTTHVTKEEQWLEAVIRHLTGLDDDTPIEVDMDVIKNYGKSTKEDNTNEM